MEVFEMAWAGFSFVVWCIASLISMEEGLGHTACEHSCSWASSYVENTFFKEKKKY